MAAQNNGVPGTIQYEGTQYLHCRPVEGYPFQTAEKTIVIEGTAKEEQGTRTEPWWGLSVAGSMLFTAHDGAMLYCREMAEKRLTVKGYRGTGRVVMTDYLFKKPRTIIFDHALFVTEIEGWTCLTGYPVNESIGAADLKPSVFWMETSRI